MHQAVAALAVEPCTLRLRVQSSTEEGIFEI